ncbi:MAG: NADH-quinone oxidoreductase subunit A [bacterium]|jgi:NADH-quinone oxidoreductase subunit A
MLVEYLPLLATFCFVLLTGFFYFGITQIQNKRFSIDDSNEDEFYAHTVKKAYGNFYLIGILISLFMAVILALFPWMIQLQTIHWVGFCGLTFFILMMILGLVYASKQGALEWK